MMLTSAMKVRNSPSPVLSASDPRETAARTHSIGKIVRSLAPAWKPARRCCNPNRATSRAAESDFGPAPEAASMLAGNGDSTCVAPVSPTTWPSRSSMRRLARAATSALCEMRMTVWPFSARFSSARSIEELDNVREVTSQQIGMMLVQRGGKDAAEAQVSGTQEKPEFMKTLWPLAGEHPSVHLCSVRHRQGDAFRRQRNHRNWSLR